MRILLSQNTLKKYRISPVYEPDYIFSLSGHLCTAPLEVVNHGGNKCHVIVNHSFQNNKLPIDIDNLPLNTPGKYIIDPSQTSINTVVDLKNFQCAWSSFSKCYLLVADAPEGTQAAVFDVDAAFRNIPTHPSACLFLAIMIKGLIHLDHVLNFGASSSQGIFGRVTNAMVRFLLTWGIEAVIKWDFVFLHYPIGHLLNGTYDFSYSADLIWSITDKLGQFWALAKFVNFAPSFNYIGFLWDLSAKLVQLPTKKKLKYLDQISSWTPRFTHSQRCWIYHKNFKPCLSCCTRRSISSGFLGNLSAGGICWYTNHSPIGTPWESSLHRCINELGH